MDLKHKDIKPGLRGSICYSFVSNAWSPVLANCTVMKLSTGKSPTVTVKTDSGKIITTDVGNFLAFSHQNKPGKQLRLIFG